MTEKQERTIADIRRVIKNDALKGKRLRGITIERVRGLIAKGLDGRETRTPDDEKFLDAVRDVLVEMDMSFNLRKKERIFNEQGISKPMFVPPFLLKSMMRSGRI